MPLPVVAATGLLPSVPVELALVEPAALVVDGGAGGPFGPGGACVVVVGCAVGSGVAVLASSRAANDCVSVPCAAADDCDHWEAWEARVALTSDAILDTARAFETTGCRN